MEKIVLDYPVTVDKVEVKSLNMRRPKVRDQLAAEKGGGGNAEQEVRLFANLCEVPSSTVEELDMVDYAKLQEKYRGFLSSRPGSAEEPS